VGEYVGRAELGARRADGVEQALGVVVVAPDPYLLFADRARRGMASAIVGAGC